MARSRETSAEKVRTDEFRADEGAAAAEFAAVMPAVVLLIVILAGAAAIGLAQLRAHEAARSAARELARGEPESAVIEEAHKHAGEHSRITIGSDGGYSTVTVTIALPEAIVVLDEVAAEATARTEGSRSGGGNGGGEGR